MEGISGIHYMFAMSTAAVILLDVVLGYGAHLDPAAELGPAVQKARAQAAKEGRELIVIAAITGTENDPQRLSRQSAALAEAGVILCASNAITARVCLAFLHSGGLNEGTPLLIASMPVSAVQPDAKAFRMRRMPSG